MIRKFDRQTCLLLIDVQVGVNVFEHWGGPTGRRNNPDAETNMRALLDKFRSAGRQVAFTVHDSREANSPLKRSLEAAGIEVAVFSGKALCIGCEGGPTCMSRPILRSDHSGEYYPGNVKPDLQKYS
ncbi:MAG: hypothetical protein GY815_00835 [Gammaproteobacteria bacterium]|nr:hypothetical protein [Gammaproteobacteria bacterium]